MPFDYFCRKEILIINIRQCIDFNIETEAVKCDLCGKDNAFFLIRTRDYRYGNTETFNFVKCSECGLIYLNPRPTDRSILFLYAKTYIGDNDIHKDICFEKEPKWKRIVRPSWYKFVGSYIVSDRMEKGRFLDIGCGCGDTLLAAREIGQEIYGIEVNPKLVEKCNEKGLNVYPGKIEDNHFPDNYFDAIWMSQVIEHLPSPKNSLMEVRRILKPGGRVHIFCPNAGSYLSWVFGRYWEGWYVPFHFYVFNEDTLRILAMKIGLKVEEIRAATPDRFLIVSLKSYLWGAGHYGVPPLERGKFLDTILFRACISPFLRLFDLLLKGKGDCLEIVLSKK